MQFFEYKRELAKDYALKWAGGRNPKYYNFENLGGDCTNFASQCVYAGSEVMNFDYPLGWFYKNAYSRSPSWTSAQFFSDFLLREEKSVGPVAKFCELKDIKIGDIVQIKTNGVFSHSLVVTKIEGKEPFNVFICAHSYDAKNRRLSTYNLDNASFLHILGVYK